MNYRLNFQRLFRENRLIKIEQQWKFLKYIHTLTAPDNALVMYFYGYIQKQLFDEIDLNLIDKFEKRLAESSYWAERMNILGLSADDLRNGQFPVAVSNTAETEKNLVFSI